MSESTFTPCPPDKCAVLVPVAQYVEPACEVSLQVLEQRCYVVRRIRGYTDIALGRCQMATDALAEGFEETFWIDADTGFSPDEFERMRQRPDPVICGIYPKKGRRELAVHCLPNTEKIVFGKQGGVMEVKYAPTGFLLVRREVYERVQDQLELPLCLAETGRPLVPFYAPLVVPDPELEGAFWYLADDYAFCERARQCGYKIMADTTVRLFHIGTYAFGWEDAGSARLRYGSFEFRLTPPQSDSTASADAAITPVSEVNLPAG